MNKYLSLSIAAMLALLAPVGCGSGGSGGSSTPPDETAPSIPTSVIVSAFQSQIDLSWSASMDNVGVSGYKIYRQGTYLRSSLTLTASDMGLAASTEYCYTVSAYDQAGNESNQSTQACATTGSPGDTSAPSAPAGLTAISLSSSAISLSWTASTDNIGVSGYKIYRQGTYLKSSATVSASDTDLTASTQYCYTVAAHDAAGNESVQSTQACATTLSPDIVSPTVPGGLSATPFSFQRINLAWTAATDTIGVAGYKIYRDGSYLKSATTTTTFDSGLLAATQYCYMVTAYDAAANESAQSTSVCAKTWTVESLPWNPGGPFGYAAYTSIAVDTGKKAHISYLHGYGLLRYATNSTGAWTYDEVDGSYGPDVLVGAFSSIALDSGEKPHIAYYDSTNKDLKYATKSGGSWSVEAIDTAGSVGSDTSLAIASSDTVHITYYDATNGDLKYATKPLLGTWATGTIDTVGNVGRYTSLALDSMGNAYAAYHDVTNGTIKYADNSSGSWQVRGMIAASAYYPSIAVDSAGNIHCSYFHVDINSDGYLVYAIKTPGGSWTSTTIEKIGQYGQIKLSSLALDSGGKAHISYYSIIDHLRYATNASGSWMLASPDDNGPSDYTSIALDSEDKVHFSYSATMENVIGYATNR